MSLSSAALRGLIREALGDPTAEVLPVVVIAQEDPDILVPTEALHGPDVGPQVEGARYGRMPETVRPGPDVRPLAQAADDAVDRRAGEALPLAPAGPVQGGEEG